jgi:hypothetical protein
VFITVGDQEKLLKFLELNPRVPRSLSFVDDTEDFEAYAKTGFGSIGQGERRACLLAIKLEGFY